MNKISVLKALAPTTSHSHATGGAPHSFLLIRKSKSFNDEDPVELCTFTADPPYRYLGTKVEAEVIKTRLEKLYQSQDYLIVEISV